MHQSKNWWLVLGSRLLYIYILYCLYLYSFRLRYVMSDKGSKSQVSNTRPAGRMRATTSFYAAPDGLKDIRSPLNPVLLFWRLQIKWICVRILEKCSCVQYFYSWINKNQMQRELLPSHWKCGRLCFDRRVFIYLFICIRVTRITKNVLNRIAWNLVGWLVIIRGPFD